MYKFLEKNEDDNLLKKNYLGNNYKSISNIALVGTENVPRFLAAHAPIQNIIDESTNQNLTDEELFTQLIETPKKEMLVVLYGMPGSGNISSN